MGAALLKANLYFVGRFVVGLLFISFVCVCVCVCV